MEKTGIDPEAEWLAKITKRHYEYAKLAYEHLNKKDLSETDVNNAKLYLANMIGSTENLYDFYTLDTSVTHATFEPDQPKERGAVARFLLGDKH